MSKKKHRTAREKLVIELMKTLHGVTALADMLEEEDDKDAGLMRCVANLAWFFTKSLPTLKEKVVRHGHMYMGATGTDVGSMKTKVRVLCQRTTDNQSLIEVKSFSEHVMGVKIHDNCKEGGIVRKCHEMLLEARTKDFLIELKDLGGFGKHDAIRWRDRYRWAIKQLAAVNLAAPVTIAKKARP